MRLAILLVILALAAILASASANIPPGLHTSVPEPTSETLCDEYIATHPTERMDDWLYTLQQGLISNPQLEQDVWDCVMDTYKVAVTDLLMLGLCKVEPMTPFNDLAMRALSAHLEQCGLSVEK